MFCCGLHIISLIHGPVMTLILLEIFESDLKFGRLKAKYLYQIGKNILSTGLFVQL